MLHKSNEIIRFFRICKQISVPEYKIVKFYSSYIPRSLKNQYIFQSYAKILCNKLPQSSSSSSSSTFLYRISSSRSCSNKINSKDTDVQTINASSKSTSLPSTKSSSPSSSPSSSSSSLLNSDDKKESENTVAPSNTTTTTTTTTVTSQHQQKNDAHPNSATTQLEINTKKGKLLVTARTQGSKINDVIMEKVAVAAPNEKTKSTQTANPSLIPTLSTPKRSSRIDSNRSTMERNFITPTRAMSDFLLKASDLEGLPKIKRRSPYEQEPPITVYWRKDVEAKAIQVWGSRENLLRECLKREIERKKHQQNIFTVKRRLRDYRREIGSRATLLDEEAGLLGKSGRVILVAVGVNTTNLIFKTWAWLSTGSHSMFAEVIHSFADTVNQLILAYGIHKSTQMADSDHPYGYSNMKYVSSLISGVGIFCVGTGLSFYHGIIGLLHPEPIEDFYWAFIVLAFSLISEGFTLGVAVDKIRKSAKEQKMTFKEYVLRGQDPSVNVVLTEDTAAVASVIVAASCMGVTSITGSSIPDAVGSLLVGGILGAVASFIIYSNVAALVGKSIPEESLNKINAELESDVMIRAIHDVKGIDMGNSLVRYKAEVDFDGKELSRAYLEKQDLNELLKTVKSFQTIDELEQFMLTHGENIVDSMGGEIDRIELKLRKKFPEIRHCDLEIL